MATRSFMIEQGGTIVATYRQGEGEAIDSALSVAEVQRALTEYYPDLLNAISEEKTEGEGENAVTVVTFRKRTGTKGGVTRRRTMHSSAGDEDGVALVADLAVLAPQRLAIYGLYRDLRRMSLADQLSLAEDEIARAVREAEREAQATGALLGAWKDLAPQPRS
jgi:hypothetical protein